MARSKVPHAVLYGIYSASCCCDNREYIAGSGVYICGWVSMYSSTVWKEVSDFNRLYQWQLKIIHTIWSRLRVFFSFAIALCRVLLLYFAVLVACCLYSETACLINFWILFAIYGWWTIPILCVWKPWWYPKCTVFVVWSPFSDSHSVLTKQTLLKWYRKGLRTVCSTDVDTVYNIWSQNKVNSHYGAES